MTAATPSHPAVGPGYGQPSKAVPGAVAILFGRASVDQDIARSYAHALKLNVIKVVHRPAEAVSLMAEVGARFVFTTCEELSALGPDAVVALRAAVERNNGELHAAPLPERRPPAASPLQQPPTVAKLTGAALIANLPGLAPDRRHGS